MFEGPTFRESVCDGEEGASATTSELQGEFKRVVRPISKLGNFHARTYGVFLSLSV